jgi:hypothetical protein
VASDDLYLDLRLHFSTWRTDELWFKKRQHLERALDAIAPLPFFAELTRAGVDCGRMKRFANLKEAKALVAIGKDTSTTLESETKASIREDAMVGFGPLSSGLAVVIWIGGAALQRHRATIVDDLERAAIGIRAAMRPIAGLYEGYAGACHVSGLRFAYPRQRPPRRDRRNPDAAKILELIDVPFQESQHVDADPAYFMPLAQSKRLRARRTEIDGLVSIRWASSGSTPDLQRAASARAIWFARTTKPPVDFGWNEQADFIEDRRRWEPKPPLSSYSRYRKTGYQAVDGTSDRRHWTVAKQVLDAKKLPGGEEIEAVKLVAPSRELALQLVAEAKKMGFAAVLYEKDGKLWDPDPPGEWITRSSDHGQKRPRTG